MRQGKEFKGRQLTAGGILWAGGWDLMFPISYRNLELWLRCIWAPRKIHPCRSHAKRFQGLSDRREQLSDIFRGAHMSSCHPSTFCGNRSSSRWPAISTADPNTGTEAPKPWTTSSKHLSGRNKGRRPSRRKAPTLSASQSHQSCAQARVGLRAPSRALRSRLLPALGAKADHEASRRAAISRAKGRLCLRTLHS